MVPVTQQFRVSCTARPPLGRPDNGSEFTAHAVREWLGRIGVKALYIEPGTPWVNGYNERFNGTLRGSVERMDVPDEQRRFVLWWDEQEKNPGNVCGICAGIFVEDQTADRPRLRCYADPAHS